jgi:hypothetical protein
MVWKWKGVMVSILTSLIIVLRVMMTMGYCIIPNRRGLVQRLIKTILTKDSRFLPKQPLTFRHH